MKYFVIITLFLGSAAMAQETQTVYDKVIGIMKTEFDYDYEAEANTIKTVDLTQPSAQQSSETKLPPLVLLDGKAVKVNSLKNYTTAQIKKTNIYLPGSNEAKLYGTAGSERGVINVSLNE